MDGNEHLETLGGMNILMMLILSIHEQVYASTSLYLLQFLLLVSYNFRKSGLSSP